MLLLNNDPHRVAQEEAYTRMVERTGRNPDVLHKEIENRKLSILAEGLKNSKVKDIRLLDVGCFDGSFLYLFGRFFTISKISFRSVGIDLVHSCCKETNRKGFESIRASADIGLPFKDKVFNVVFSSEVIEHCLDTLNFLKEIRRVLENNGLLFLTTPNLNSIRNRWRVLFGKYPYGLEGGVSKYSVGHVRIFNFYTLEDYLEICGFEVVERKTLNLLPIRFSRKKWLKGIDLLLCKLLYSLGSRMVFLAKRKNDVD